MSPYQIDQFIAGVIVFTIGYACGWAESQRQIADQSEESTARRDADDLTAAADGPRYRALGNSMAVPVMRWIGERIARAYKP